MSLEHLIGHFVSMFNTVLFFFLNKIWQQGGKTFKEANFHWTEKNEPLCEVALYIPI